MPNYIQSVMAKTGLPSAISIGSRILAATRDGNQTEHAYLGIHHYLVEYANGNQPAFWTVGEERQVREGIRRLDQLTDCNGFLSITLAISEEFLPLIDQENPFGKNLDAWEATEALIFRAYEGLRSIRHLVDHGLMVDVDLIFRAVIESVLLCTHILNRPKRATKVKIRGWYDHAEELYGAISFDLKHFNKSDEDLRDAYSRALAELGPYSLIVLNDFTENRTWKGNVPGMPKWMQLVDDPILRKVYGAGHQHKAFQNAYMRGNAAAHSSSFYWSAYVQFHEEEQLKQVAKILDDEKPISTINFLILTHYLEALSRIRSSLPEYLCDWAALCQRRAYENSFPRVE